MTAKVSAVSAEAGQSAPESGSSGDRAAAVAARLFAAKGYSATTTRELSAALGVTNGTLYHHFESKEALLLLLCNESLSRITSEVAAAVGETHEPRGRLATLIRAHVVTMLRDQDLHKTMLTELRSLSGDNLEAVKGRRDDYSRFVREVIEEEQTAGAVRGDIPAKTLALLLLNMLNWTIFWFRPDGDLRPAELADAIVSTFLDGAAATAAR
jgi:AcrR family transcriptional regulator